MARQWFTHGRSTIHSTDAPMMSDSVPVWIRVRSASPSTPIRVEAQVVPDAGAAVGTVHDPVTSENEPVSP